MRTGKIFLDAILVAAAIFILVALVYATDHPAGPVTGIWSPAGNPHNVWGEIYVPINQSLTIQPGVQVIFIGHYKFRVDSNAILTAVGTLQDSILFTSATYADSGWGGLRFWKATSYSELKYCHITRGWATPGTSISSTDGGGIYCFKSGLLIHNCRIDSCKANGYGGGIEADSCNLTLKNCIISNNTAAAGGGLSLHNIRASTINNNLICRNKALGVDGYGGGIYSNGSTFTLENNTIAHDTAATGGGIYKNTQSASITNCIVWANSSGLVQATGSFLVNHSDIQDSLYGLTNYSENPYFLSGIQGDYYLKQNPPQTSPPYSPSVNTGYGPMITGTTRTDGFQDEGIVDMGYHYQSTALFNVALTPINPPIQILHTGGSFQFNAAAQRNISPQAPFWVWCRIKNPTGSYTLPTIGPIQINPPVAMQLSRQRTQNVPGTWAPGTYTYLGYANTLPQVYPAIDADSFTFVKLADGPPGPTVWDAVCYGEPFPGEIMESAGELQPTSFALNSASPNPFNPTTAISYKLQAASYVSLRVYDTAGRIVTELVNGWREAGSHEVTFDGSNLASGVYLYVLSAGDYHACGKMVLLK